MVKNLQVIAFFVLVIFLVEEAKAQQEQTFTHFMFQQAIFNPAVTGNEPSILVNGLMRQQWVGLAGAPKTFFVNLQSPVSFLKGGAGATIINDQIGPFTSTGLKLAYAYRKKFWQGDLSFGLNAGFINKTINYAYFNVQDDPLLSGAGTESGMIFNLDLGVYYEEKGHYYIGISSTQINQGKMILEGGQTSLSRNFYLNGGYFFTLRQYPQFVFHASSMLEYTKGAPLQVNTGIIAEYNKKFWGGVTYRHQSAIGILVGLNYKQFSAGYGYEINMTPLKNSGTHELMIGYRFLIEIEKGNKSYKNTRYL